jgi:hypothetical protein
MVESIKSIFILTGESMGDRLIKRSTRGGRANYKKHKPCWDKGDEFAKRETILFGGSIIAACRATRGNPDAPQTVDEVIKQFHD